MKKKLSLMMVAFLALATFAATWSLRAANPETLFSAAVTATANVSFPNGTTEIASDQATLIGGKMWAISQQEAEKTLIGKQGSNYMFCLTNNNTFFKIELDKALAAGDVISAKTFSRTDTELGLFLSTAESRPNECATALKIAAAATGAYEALSDYTVTAGDGLEGASTFYIYRATGKSTYFNEFVITRPNSEEGDEPTESTWKDIKADFTNGSFLTATDTDVTTAGLKMNDDGTFSRVAADDATANALITGKFHSNDHGLQNFSATIAVEGPVKITLGTCAWGGNVTVKNAEGTEVVPAFTTNTGACYHQNKEANTVSAFYKGGATTLTIAGGSYVPYFAVEAVNPADIPNDAKVTFDKGEAEGVAPAEQIVEIGQQVTIPANTTLYLEGKTLTAWTDGSQQYKAGDKLTAAADMTLTPVFTDNIVALADRTAETTLVWQFGERNGAGTLNAQGKTTILVTQATIGEQTIDVKMSIDATKGKINNVGRGDEWAQCNDGTVLTIPACKGVNVSFSSYGDAAGTTIGGEQATNKAAVYDGTAATLDIVAKGMSYISNVTAVYPVPTQDDNSLSNFAVQLTNADVFNTSINNFGVKVAEDGTYTATAANDATARFIVNAARFNDAQHGWVNCTFTIPVNGPVKIGLGNCEFGAQDGTITDAAGNVTNLTVGNANCWTANNIEGTTSYTIYKGTKPTTLTVKQNGYCPFISVESVDPSQLKSDATVTFASGEVENGIVPAAIKEEVGKTITLPKNFTLYAEGKTLTAWTDGTNDYAPGTEYTVPENDVTLTAKFTANEVNLADRTEPVTLAFNFRRDQGAPTVAYQNATGIWVTQATVKGKTIDVKADFDTNNGGKFANGNWNDWAQLNNGTKWTVPSCKGATVSIEAFAELGAADKTATTIDGQSDYATGKTISYTIAGAAETVDVIIGNDGSYYRYIKVELPVVQQQGSQKYVNEAAKVVWAMTNPDNTNANEATPDGVFSVIAFDSGDTQITGTSKITNENAQQVATGIKFKPAGSTQSLSWNVKPAAGLTFTPTKLTGYVNRCGTDAENGITIRAYKEGGEPIVLGTWTALRSGKTNQTTGENATTKAYDAKAIYQYVIELTAEQQASLASADGFYLTSTVGVNNNKEGAFGEVTIEGLINGEKANIEMFTLATVASPEDAGTINVYPASDSYEDGSEVTLTATENFGYDFVNWTNAAGEEVSTEAKFKYTMTANETLTANFKKVETYELALTVDGTNKYMVTVNPVPTIVDGKWMYEAGQAVQLTANQYEGLVAFNNWSDGETSSSKLVSMDANVALAAIYSEADIIAGWDFYLSGGNGRKADFYAQDNDADALNLVNTETGETSGWLDKSAVGAGGYESFKGAAVNWRTGSQNGDVGHWHWQTKVNAEAFTDINVQFQMMYNYNAYQTYNVEYSLDGTEWTKVGSITMSGAKAEASFNGKLPAACNNQKELYIRMIADKNSKVDGTASANDGNTLAMFFITGTPKLVNDGVAPVLVSTVPANGTIGTSASGKIVLTFDERVKMAEGAKATLGTLQISPVVNGKTATFEYKGLEYATDYTFTLPANSVSDLTDNMLAEAITLTFTTMSRPEVKKGAYDVVVENAEQLVAAINAANSRTDKNARYRIFVKKGTYKIPTGKIKHYTHKRNDGTIDYDGDLPDPITYINAGNISITGEDRDATIITQDFTNDASMIFQGQFGPAHVYEEIGNSDVFQFASNVSGMYLQDITVKSGINDALGRNLAIQDKGTKNIYKNTVLYGYQDTWTSNNDNGYYYFEGGQVRGRTDYLCGKGDAFFNGVELRQLKGGYAAVPSKSIKYGYTFKDCIINGDEAGVDGNYTLGRPWGSGTPVALFIDTRMNVVPSAIGWNEMSNGWPKRFAEFNSTTASGSQIDLSGRKKTFGEGHPNNPILTAEEALEAGNLHNMFGDWDPTLLTEQAPAPANVTLTGNTLTWDNSKYAFCWAVVKNGSVVDFTTEPTYTIDDATATWAVRAANEMGGLGEAIEAGISTGISEIKEIKVANNAIYNMQGIRVSKTGKGLYIINGKKELR